MNCATFQQRFHAQTEDAALLGHLRGCDACLELAANIDPDVLFRAIGGDEVVPPGGIDSFVGDVMRQVRVRQAESQLAPPPVVAWPRRLAIAAALAVAILGTALYERMSSRVTPEPLPALVRAVAPVKAPPLLAATKPVVETYASQTATIVEVPAEGADDVKIVMIFDESLPVDL